MRRINGLASAVLIAAAIAVGSSPAASHAVPPDFADTTVPNPAGNPLASPTGIFAMGDGRALITEKGGTLRVLLADGTIAAQDAITLPVCTGSEQGLLGAAVDPAFAVNGYVYLYYSHKVGDCSQVAGRANRVSRFTMTGNALDPSSELVLLDNMVIQAGNHNGGDLNFGADGYLYVSVGDSGSNPRGGSSAAQDLSDLNGKILRITGTGDSPSDNPFVGAPGAAACRTAGISLPTSTKCTEIYAYGLRNPYRFAFDPNSNNSRFFINDVGQGTWEEVDLGIKGANYGWDVREGPCAYPQTSNCGPAPAGYTDPLTSYNHTETSCTFITAGAFIPNGVWPAQYDGGYLFGDGGCGRVWLRSADGAVNYDAPFTQASGITDMAFVKQNGITSLFYVANGSPTLHKITYQKALPPPEPNEELVPLAPARLADTRPTFATVDGIAAGGGALPSGGTLELPVLGRGGVAQNAVAVSLNVTSVDGAGAGFVTVFPCGSAQPLASNLNFTRGATVPNAVIARIGNGGKVCIFASVQTDIVIDVGGYFPPTTSLTSINPIRLADTRDAHTTIDGQSQATGLPAAESVTKVKVAGRAGVPSSISAAVLNVTITEATGPGYAVAYPCDSPAPTASNLNYVAGSTVAALVVGRVATTGADAGSVCIYTQLAAHIVVDIDGWFTPTSRVQTMAPTRFMDTRPGRPTADQQLSGGGPVHLGGVVSIPVVGRQSVTSLARSVIVNVTVTEPAAAGFVTVFPCGIEPPLASTVNFAAGQTVANAAIVAIGSGGAVCAFASQETQLIIDVSGVVVSTTSPT